MVSVTCGIVKEHYDKNMIKGGYHMVSKKMYELGTKKSTIRTIFEFGRKRAAEVGEENIYDFSLGNPNVPTPEFVKQAAIDILQTMPPATATRSRRAIRRFARRWPGASTTASARTLRARTSS